LVYEHDKLLGYINRPVCAEHLWFQSWKV
jgi:hypothetical protein